MAICNGETDHDFDQAGSTDQNKHTEICIKKEQFAPANANKDLPTDSIAIETKFSILETHIVDEDEIKDIVLSSTKQPVVNKFDDIDLGEHDREVATGRGSLQTGKEEVKRCETKGGDINSIRKSVVQLPTCHVCQARLADGDRTESRKVSIVGKIKGNGHLRHIVALLALSSIVLANMNRQTFNQALSRMVRTRKDAQTTSVAPILNESNTENWADLTTRPIENTLNLLGSTEFSTMVGGTGAPGGTESWSAGSTEAYDREYDIKNEDVILDDLYDWDGKQVGMLQGAFSYGYMPFMIAGGRLSEIYGAKWVIFLSGFGSALCSLMTPFLANYSFSLLVTSRVLMGIFQTGVSPALYALLTRWLAPDESSVYLAMIKVGVMIGFMCGSLINGFLPWRTTFYAVGLISLLWSIMWIICVTSNPDEHKFINEKELAYIQESLGRKVTAPSSASTTKKKKTDGAPWLKIITNPVVLAFMYTKFTVKLSTDTQSMQLPMYLKNVLKVSDELNGPLNAANFAIQAIFTGVVAWTAKEMIVRKSFGLSKSNVRCIFQGINNFGMGLGYLMISLCMGSLELACFAVMIISVSSMFGSGGEAVIPVDLTTEYSASIMAIANSVANFSGIVLPPMVSLLLNNQLTDPVRWNHVWYTIAGIVMSGGLIFSLFAKAKLQNFEKPEEGCDGVKDEMTHKEAKLPVTVIEMSSIVSKI